MLFTANHFSTVDAECGAMQRHEGANLLCLGLYATGCRARLELPALWWQHLLTSYLLGAGQLQHNFMPLGRSIRPEGVVEQIDQVTQDLILGLQAWAGAEGGPRLEGVPGLGLQHRGWPT